MRNIIHEIHRRSLWQVLGIYVGVGWLVLQVVDLIIDNFALPEWVAPFALILLLVGLPVVLGTAFVQEGVGSSDAGGADESSPPLSDPMVEEPVAARREASGDPAPSAAAHEAPPQGRAPAAAHGVAAASTPAGAGGRLGRRLTWRNAILGGLGAFGLLGLLTAGYLAMRALGIGPAGTLVAKGLLEERSAVLVADFEGDDADLAHTATDAFRIDLGQSQVVKVIEPTEIAQVLQRMDRLPDAPLTLDLAREVAIREGIPAIVAGDVDRAGASVVVSARLLVPEDGTVLVSDRRTAESDAEVLSAIDALSARLRERIGESLRDLGGEEPLEAVTTGSLLALRKYSQALRAFELSGDEDRSIALLEEAVELDSTFAMAWRKLGTILNNRFEDRARAVDALEHAFRHRARLTERERYHVEGIYNYQIGNDVAGAITAYQNVIELDPEADWALNNLGVMYGYLRDHDRAAEYYQAAIAVDSSNSLAHTNAAQELFAQGRTDDARTMLATFGRRFPGHPSNRVYAAAFASATGDYAEAERQARELIREQAGNAFVVGEATRALAAFAAIQGRIGEARELLESTMEAAAGADRAAIFLQRANALAAIEVRTLGPEAATATLAGALDRFPLEDIAPLDRPYTELAITLARAGQTARARRLLDEMDTVVDRRLRSPIQAETYDAARAFTELREGRYDAAIEWARRADRGFCSICAAHVLGEAYHAAGDTDSAIAAYRRYVDTQWIFRFEALDQFMLASDLERLGQLYDETGDLESAADFYARFVDLWSGADPELRPRIEAAQARLEEIVRARG